MNACSGLEVLVADHVFPSQRSVSTLASVRLEYFPTATQSDAVAHETPYISACDEGGSAVSTTDQAGAAVAGDAAATRPPEIKLNATINLTPRRMSAPHPARISGEAKAGSE